MRITYAIANFKPERKENFWDSSWIWTASSRVGARPRAEIGTRRSCGTGGAPRFSRCQQIGSINAKVLPCNHAAICQKTSNDIPAARWIQRRGCVSAYGTGLRAGHDVTARDSDGDRMLLDWSRDLVLVEPTGIASNLSKRL